MSRSNYSEDGEYLNLWRGTVERAINGKRGQAFLRELAKEMDAMPVKRLIEGELISEQGEVCAIGVVCKARGLKGLSEDEFDVWDPAAVGKLVGISMAMAAEIEYENDEQFSGQTPEERFIRMREWVAENIKP